MALYKEYKVKLAAATNTVQAIRVVREAYGMTSTGSIKLTTSEGTETLTAMKDIRDKANTNECNVLKCEKCSSLGPNHCADCESPYTLSNGRCKGW